MPARRKTQKLQSIPKLSPNAIVAYNNSVYLLYGLKNGKLKDIRIDESHDGIRFNPKGVGKKGNASTTGKTSEKSDLVDIRIASIDSNFYMTYKYQKGGKSSLFSSVSSDLRRWKGTTELSQINETGAVVSQFKYKNKYVMYYGDSIIRCAYSADLKRWEKAGGTLLEPHKDFFGVSPLKVANAFVTNDGIVLLYYVHVAGKVHNKYSLFLALLDRENPTKLVKRYNTPLWETTRELMDKGVYPLGVVSLGAKLISYWLGRDGVAYAVSHILSKKQVHKVPEVSAGLLKKLKDNPILKPISDHFWESRATFNPAALYEKGKVHIVYRAIGDHDISVLGYASSSDGRNIEERHPEPIFAPKSHLGAPTPYVQQAPSLSPYTSGGGGYGGCEDPRLTKIGDKIYMTYVAYDGHSPPRVALTSIKADNFFNHNWDWEKPVLISPPDVVDKNAVIFPEKINGKYVIMHRIFPNILIDYVDSLDFNGSTFLKGEHKIRPRLGKWDSRKVGAGAPPIKTDEGWLLIYHAVGDNDSAKYKMGAMLLDAKDPTKVLYRSKKPILEPTESYENEGYKAGVAYPCGAVKKDDELLVYYGGADMVACVASAKLSTFLSRLKSSDEAEVYPLNSHVAIN